MKLTEKNHKNANSRRNFLSQAAVAGAGLMIVPRSVLGGAGYTAPSDKVNVAGIGVGGMGKNNIRNLKEISNIVALCDVDWEYAGKVFKDYPEAKIYVDYRKMLDEMHKDIDAVVIATPDHTHAMIAMEAMRRKKHVYCQKPLTYTVEEARVLNKAAKKYGVITQMGNQGHAQEGARLINEFVWEGAIGNVREVHCWTNRPIWPQGISRPQEIPSIPPTLEWNLWLGPAPYRTYHPAYVPFKWRGWIDFGVGAMGDMGAHIIDHPYWALHLRYPNKIQASTSKLSQETYPNVSVVTFEFPARNKMPPVTLTWYDGGIKPPRPAELEQGRRLGVSDSGGILFMGDKGTLMAGCYGNSPRLIPESRMKEYGKPKQQMERSPGIHEEWIEAIQTNNTEKATSNFSYSSPLTEVMLLGNIAVLMSDQNIILDYDEKTGRFTNSDEANALLHREYRRGFYLVTEDEKDLMTISDKEVQGY